MSGVERTVRAVVTTYVHPDGAPRTALRGEEIQVHPDHLAAFDEGEALVPEPRVDVAPLDLIEEPPRAGRGSGLEAWTAYATAIGLAVPQGASRDDVIALVDDQDK